MAVITGVGIVSPLAEGREATWQRLLAGESALRWLDEDPSCARLFEQLQPGIERAAGGPAKVRPHDGREPCIALALAAAQEAVFDAALNLNAEDRTRVGCVIGTSKGGVKTQHELARRQWLARSQPGLSDEPREPDWWSQIAPSGPAQAVCEQFGIAGAVLAPVAACATGLACLVRAAELIQHGDCDVVLAGSSDASLTPAILASFRRLGVLARHFDDPTAAVRPFDRNRSGFLIGEGAAVMVLESEAHARARHARIQARWRSAATAADATGLTQLNPQPDALIWLIRETLRRADLQAADLDLISLHGTATRINDLCEARAVRAALGSATDSIAAFGIKGALGHLLGAAGSVEFATMLLALRDGIAPAVTGLLDPDPDCPIPLVTGTPRHQPLRRAMKLSLGFGGHLVAAIVERDPNWPCTRRGRPPNSP